MPFRCKCGRTYENTDTFATHTSCCSLFQQRRMSDASQQRRMSDVAQQLQDHRRTSEDQQLSSSVPSSFFMPTALSLQSAFEGARRRSLSNANKPDTADKN
jgi:hypothetical protein